MRGGAKGLGPKAKGAKRLRAKDERGEGQRPRAQEPWAQGPNISSGTSGIPPMFAWARCCPELFWSWRMLPKKSVGVSLPGLKGLIQARSFKIQKKTNENEEKTNKIKMKKKTK